MKRICVFFKKHPFIPFVIRCIGLFLILIILDVLFSLFFQKKQPDVDNQCLNVRSNCIVMGYDSIVYRFMPIEGGNVLLGHVDRIPINSSDTSSYVTYQYDYVNDYLLGEKKVTNKLYDYVMYNSHTLNPYSYASAIHTYTDWKNFIDTLSKKTGRKFRMPTNDEWEYASELEKRNGLGFYDMLGDVWELTSTNVYVGESPSWINSYSTPFVDNMPILRRYTGNSSAEECSIENSVKILSSIDSCTALRLILEY